MRVTAAYVPLQPRRFTIAPTAVGCKRWLATAVPEAGQTIDAVETADELLARYEECLQAIELVRRHS